MQIAYSMCKLIELQNGVSIDEDTQYIISNSFFFLTIKYENATSISNVNLFNYIELSDHHQQLPFINKMFFKVKIKSKVRLTSQTALKQIVLAILQSNTRS